MTLVAMGLILVATLSVHYLVSTKTGQLRGGLEH